MVETGGDAGCVRDMGAREEGAYLTLKPTPTPGLKRCIAGSARIYSGGLRPIYPMPRLRTAIVYDADPQGLATLAYGFEIDGIKAAASSDAAEAQSALTAAAAQAAVLIVRPGDIEGERLVRLLAEAPAHAQLPRLVLANSETPPGELAGLHGPAGFLPLPAYVRDVITAAKLLAGGAAAGRPPFHEAVDGDPAKATVLEGALSDFGLFFIVRTMVGLGLSGVVEVERGNRKGELRFFAGELTSAQVGNLEGEPALHQLLLWEEAALVLRFRPTVRRGSAFKKGDELLDDCARFLRDFEHATRNIGHAQSLFVQDAEITASVLDTIGAELVPVMRLFDGHRNLGDVLEDSPYRAFDTLRSIARLIELKTIRRKAIEKPSTGLPNANRKRPDEPRPESRAENWLSRSADLPSLSTAAASRATAAVPSGPPAIKPTTASTPTMPMHVPARDLAGDASREAAGPAPAGQTGTSETARGRRSFRRKTGEHAIAPAPAPGGPQSTLEFPARPLVGGGPRPPHEHQEAHGELRADLRETPHPSPSAEIPTVMIDLGPEEPVSGDLDGHVAQDAEAGRDRETGDPLVPPATDATTDATKSEPSGAVMSAPLGSDEPLAKKDPRDAEAVPEPIAERALDSDVAEPLTVDAPAPGVSGSYAGIQAAEIDTGMHRPPSAALLEAPSEGPSIMIDPGLVEEMDAFELAHSPPTPPPILIPPVITAPAPAATAEAATDSPPAVSPAAPVGPGGESDAPVVSFVKGASHRGPGPGNPAFNAAPTVPLSTIAPRLSPENPADRASAESGNVGDLGDGDSPTTPAATSAHPADVAASGSPPPTTAPAATGKTDRSKGDRRASGEFDALEAEFFARESDLYKKEAVENFDDLDAATGKPRARR